MSEMPSKFLVLHYTTPRGDVSERKIPCAGVKIQDAFDQFIGDPNVHGFQVFSVRSKDFKYPGNFYVPFEGQDHFVHAEPLTPEIYFGEALDIPTLEKRKAELAKGLKGAEKAIGGAADVFNTKAEQLDDLDFQINYAKNQKFDYVVFNDKGQKMRFVNKSNQNIFVVDRERKVTFPPNFTPSDTKPSGPRR